jgi:uncharacterized RDD family membrane protein YckC
MNWYYGLNGETAGPVDESQIAALIQQGTISPDTLVWNDQMGDNWVAANQTELNRYFSGQGNFAAEDGGFCSLCGNRFPAEDLVEIGNLNSCAACKPMALRRMQENTFTGVLDYAGFWIRVGAALIDGVILYVVNKPLEMIFQSVIKSNQGQPNISHVFTVLAIYWLISFIISFSYSVFLISSKMGGTLGMKACGIAVVNADGSGPISILKSIGRYFANILNGFTLGIGYIIVAFDAEKRALHDHICSTRVIHTRR